MNSDTSLVLKNYKEPLLPVPKQEGFGYYGAVLVTLDGQKMQCAYCGGLYEDVGLHARQAHKVTNAQYKEKFQLADNTALLSEFNREKKKALTLKWITSLTPEQRDAWEVKRKAAWEKWHSPNKSAHGKKIRLETKNVRGTCPDQLIAKIQDVAKTLGKTPTKAEFIVACGGQRYVHLIYKTFGSYTKAIQRARLSPQKKDATNKGKTIHRYSDEELLEYLSDFFLEHKTIPTHSDYQRGLIPDTYQYSRRFGSMQRARELAGIYDVPKNISTLRKGKKLEEVRY